MAAQIERRARVLSGPLVPLLPPKPISRRLPPLPPRPAHTADAPVFPGWHRETLVVPAAFPRSFPNSTKRPSEPAQDPTVPLPGEKRADLNRATEFVVKNQVEGHQRQLTLEDKAGIEQQEQLVVVGNRYRPARRNDPAAEPGLTLVFSHANGFYKEVWEPVITSLLEQVERRGKSLPIDEIWALDCVIQGDSAVLNDEVLGRVFNWADHGRDLINFIAYYLDSPDLKESVGGQPPRTNPFPRPSPETPADVAQLDNRGPGEGRSAYRPKRRIVGIGHSLGGGATAYAASTCPSLFSSVIFVDPVIVPAELGSTREMVPTTQGALKRRGTWNTRQEAKDSLSTKAMFKAWDPLVLNGYFDHGLHETSEGQATLKTKPYYEALTFMDPLAAASRRACNRLAGLPESVPAHFIFADRGRSVLTEEWVQHLVSKTVPHATSTRVEGAGHLVVHEKPTATALEMVEFLERAHPRRREAKL